MLESWVSFSGWLAQSRKLEPGVKFSLANFFSFCSQLNPKFVLFSSLGHWGRTLSKYSWTPDLKTSCYFQNKGSTRGQDVPDQKRLVVREEAVARLEIWGETTKSAGLGIRWYSRRGAERFINNSCEKVVVRIIRVKYMWHVQNSVLGPW